jgi:C4-dicarboxylate-specific signal transduction histidine kinase/ABC-type uncharacterized transport system substrate-binding protein
MQKIFFLCLFLLFACIPFKAENKKVLVLHSYHPELEWTDHVNKGIRKSINEERDSVAFVYEYLDRKRNVGDTYYHKIVELFTLKFHQNHFDVIIVCDNEALLFALNNRKEFFADIPIVFCGINNYQDSLLAGQKNITGVIEKPDFKATLDLIAQFHPQAKNLYIINDNKTTTARENKKLLFSLEQKNEYRFDFHYWENISPAQIKDSLKHLEKEDVILLSTYNRDTEGNFISYKENRAFIGNDILNPVYTTWFFFMDSPAIGGKMISGEDQGQMAGQMALQILHGKSADAIAVNKKSLSKYIFSYPALQKHHISKSQLPKDAILLHQPPNFYQVNKKIILGIFFTVFVLFSIILILFNAIIRRKRAELSLLEKQQSLEKSYCFQKLNAHIVSLLNSTNDFTLVTDQILKAIIDNYHIGKVSLYHLNSEENIESIIGSNISQRGGGIKELEVEEYFKLRRIINVIKEKGVFVSNDLSNMSQEEQVFYQKREIGSIVLFVIRIGDRIFGIAGFAQKERCEWTEEQVNEFATIVRLISNAWERNVQMKKHLLAEQRNLRAAQMIEQSSRMASIGVMASGITHEINQPLNAIKVNLGAIRYWDKRNSGQLPEFIQGKLESTLKGLNRIDGIIRHMRNFWIAPSQADPLDRVSLNEVVGSAYSLVERQLIEHGVQAAVMLPEEEVMVQANSIQLEQIIINLVVNAIQALDKSSHANKIIHIRVNEEKEQAVLEVEDNATGIDEEIGETLYDPFYSTKTNGGGTGLGMALVKTFVDKLKGSIKYYNNDLGGVTFCVSLNK